MEKQECFGLGEQEKKVLEHAYRMGLLKPGYKIKRLPMEDVANDFGKTKRGYSKSFVNAKRKVLTAICKELFNA